MNKLAVWNSAVTAADKDTGRQLLMRTRWVAGLAALKEKTIQMVDQAK